MTPAEPEAFDSLSQPAVAAWRDAFRDSPSILDVVGHHVGTEATMVVVDLIHPIFARTRGCVLLPWAFTDDTLDQWFDTLVGDTGRIESAINHLHLWDVLPIDELEPVGFERLGTAIAAGWSAALAQQAPDRQFDVHFSNDDDDYGPTITIESRSQG